MKTRIMIFALLALMLSCSTSTKITGSWKADDFVKEKDFSKIAVVALAKNEADVLIVEKMFVERLKYLGYDAIVTLDFLLPNIVRKENAKEIDKMIKDRGCDALMLLSVLKVEDGVRYVASNNTPYGPGGYYGGYYGYYYYNRDRLNGGYYEETTSIFLESRFYDLDKGKIVSSIQTETVDPDGIEDLTASFSQSILKRLIADDILENNSSNK